MFPVHQQTGEHQCLKYAVSIAQHSLPKLRKFQINPIALKKRAKRRGEMNGRRKNEQMIKTIKTIRTELKRHGQIAIQNIGSCTVKKCSILKKVKPHYRIIMKKLVKKNKWIVIEDGIFSLKVIDKPNSKMDVWIVEIARVAKD
jgi:hypothetical protein